MSGDIRHAAARMVWGLAALTFAIACLVLATSCGQATETSDGGDAAATESTAQIDEEKTEASTAGQEEKSKTIALAIRAFDSAEAADESDAQVRVIVPGYDESWTDIPVRIVSFMDSKNDVDELVYLHRSGNSNSFEGSVTLPRTRYSIGVAAPVVSPDGDVYVMEEILYGDSEYETLADLREYQADGEQPAVAQITLAPLMPALVTDEMMERTLSYVENDDLGIDRTRSNLALVEEHRNEAASLDLSRRERLALEFVTAWCDIDTPSGLDDQGFTNLEPCDREEWLAECMSYLDPNSALYAYFPVNEAEAASILKEDPDADPFLGTWDAWSVLDSAAVHSSEGDTVTVAVSGWSGNGELVADFRELRPLGLPEMITVTFNSADKIMDVRVEA